MYASIAGIKTPGQTGITLKVKRKHIDDTVKTWISDSKPLTTKLEQELEFFVLQIPYSICYLLKIASV